MAPPVPAPEAPSDGEVRTPAAAPGASDLPLWQLRCTLALVRAALQGGSTLEELLDRHPVLHDSLQAAEALGLAELTLDDALARLAQRLAAAAVPAGATAAQAAACSPLQRLRAALGLGVDGLCCGVLATLADDEPRLAALVDEVQGQGGQPTRATAVRAFGAQPAAAALAVLLDAGVLQELQRCLLAPRALWALAAGAAPPRHAWRHRPLASLTTLQQLILPPEVLHAVQAVQAMQVASDASGRADEEAQAHQRATSAGPPLPHRPQLWLLRGSPGSGRQTLAAALAHAQGLGLLEALDGASATALGAAAAMLQALPLLRFEPAPGEVLRWPLPAAVPAWLAACLPGHGALQVPGADLHTLTLPPPAAAERRLHWQRALPGRAWAEEAPDADLLRLRLPRGTLHRLARHVRPGQPDALGQVLAALNEEGRHAMEGLARAVPAAGPEEACVLAEATREDFEALVQRCRHRESLAAALPAAFGLAQGVRALFKGPSGTGKTLAARQLAAALRRPLYRVDLAATVSKYIGETERNLERVFEAAEALDIVLLLDEGDALLAGRTQVANATDRYANLETNYLLQRLEHYSGVLLVTTNAAERIDPAFARRMDLSLEFPLPDAATRLALWQAHLGPRHAVPDELLEAVALRCQLAGGQIRNAVLHATLLALPGACAVTAEHLLPALAREYRKAGQRCPSFDTVPGVPA